MGKADLIARLLMAWLLAAGIWLMLNNPIRSGWFFVALLFVFYVAFNVLGAWTRRF